MTSPQTKVHDLLQERFKRVLITEFMTREVERAGFGGLVIQRTPLGTRITIRTERPGLVIGRKGRDIQRLTDEVERRFGLENPQIEAVEVKNVNLNPKIMAAKLVFALERGWNFRRAGNAMLQRIMEAGARGCQITLSGKLTGQRHRNEKFIEGHIKHCGETALQLMQTGFAVARRKEGVIGCKVAIMLPDARLPDEITVRDLEAEARAREEAERKAAEAVARKAAKAMSRDQELSADKAAAALEAEKAEAEKAAKPKGRAKKKAAKTQARKEAEKAEKAQTQPDRARTEKAVKPAHKPKTKSVEASQEEAPQTKKAALKATRKATARAEQAVKIPGTQPVEVKPAEAKPAEAKPAEAKPAEAKPVEAKPAEAKPVEAKPVEAKPVEAKPAEAQPAEVKPAKRAKAKEPEPTTETKEGEP